MIGPTIAEPTQADEEDNLRCAEFGSAPTVPNIESY